MHTDWRLEYDSDKVLEFLWQFELSAMIVEDGEQIILIPLPHEVRGRSVH